jgi:hypothetical protein
MIENTYDPVIAHTGNATSLKTGTTAGYFRKVWKYGWDKLKLKVSFRTGTNIRTTHNN